ncbi:putative toxin-antitoxin system toxin component, PIN family [Olivibacter sp. XZL3]|uniref:putative toxin-antitoxin system toxin component, PIN family n=1 Tax=Olivibacter sp. XZL3 TaxID=1735116 RepID=UPI0010668105|nr:putative toxin-antitoxin system toxin component, PIN family [Olivibacter sp. XZL3]
MPKKKDSLIIDTNLWISYLLSGNKKLDYILSNKRVTLIFSQELLDELIEVTQRPKFKKYFSFEDVSTLLHELKLRSIFINTSSNVTVCRDEKDNFLLGLAEDGKATHLVTGDKDLLVLETYKKTKIITIEEYLDKKL